MRFYAPLVCATLAGVLGAGSATAGLLNSPPPDLGSTERATVVYRMGPIHYEPGGWVDTTITCTNLATSSATVGLEIFDEEDNLTGRIAQATVAAGATVTFATSAETNVPGAVTVSQLPPLDHGKARISASTIQLSCSALNHLRASDGTIKEAALELIKKVAY